MEPTSPPSLSEQEIFALERPAPSLMLYYALSSLLLGPFFFLLLPALFFRFQTLRYRFDDEGVSMRWGVLFRREINLTYARIQDIHLVSNFVERWLGLARIQIQTASGSAKAEMTIEGIEAYEALRDFLYTRMRGSRAGGVAAADGAGRSHPDGGGDGELAAVLRQVAAEMRALRRTLERRGEGPAP